ncbi:MAG: peptide chain release factor 2 [Candidatus Saccharibacteria bacterium]
MQELINQINELNGLTKDSLAQLNIDTLQAEANKLAACTMQPKFWDDKLKAQSINKKLVALNNRINPWIDLARQIKDLAELASLNDENLTNEIGIHFKSLKKQYVELKTDLLFDGEYDEHSAILTIFAGTGGTDAQDWAEMLFRMYLRWAEATPGASVEIIGQTSGEEAGIKSATIEISGNLIYGKLRGEIGVHRLVRLSPYNANNLRQTSFAKVEVLPKIDKPEEVQIDEKDLKIDVFRAGGHGGQSVNTTDSAVRITHLPTNITVAIQNERSQTQNKETAMTILRSKLAQLKSEQHKEIINDIKGPNEQASWGNQIRSYVLHPYNMVKDLRTRHETSDTQAVLNGKIDEFITAYLEWNASQNN